jgi:OOP family OmpA-OmpF porin
MKKRLASIPAAIAIAIALVPCAQAEDLYLGANIAGRTDGYLNEREGGVTTRHDAVGKQRRFGLFAGYVLSPEWALETGYDGFGGSTDYDVAGGRLELRTSMAYLAGRRTWPLSENWSLFAKAGVARGRLGIDFGGAGASDARTVHKNSAYLSAGAAYLVARDVSLQVEFQHTGTIKHEGLTAKMNKLSLGARFGF